VEIKKEDITEGLTKFNADLVNLEWDYGKFEDSDITEIKRFALNNST
jgi:hypothetical protein